MKDISGNDKEKTVNSTPANLISLSTNNLARDKRLVLPAGFGDSRTIDLYWMHRAKGTEHFHSLRTTR